MPQKITNEKDLKESYEKIWNNSDLKEERSYYNLILNLLNVEENSKLLDVACGGGHLLNEANRKGMESFGIDIAKNAIQKAKKLNSKSELVLSSSESIPFNKNSFDYITCLGSLEHFLNPEKSMDEMGRVLKDSGRICIVLPNIWHIPDVLRGWLTGEGLSHGQESERFYSLNEAKTLIEKHSIFKIEHINKYNQPVAKPLPMFNKFYILIYRILRNKIPVSGSYVFIFICTKHYFGAPSCIEIGNKDNARYLGPGWHHTENWPSTIRWTEKKASAYLKADEKSRKLFIKAITKYPFINVDILINKEHIKNFAFNDTNWKVVEIELPELDTNIVEVIIEVDKTWVPDKILKNGDIRELGIAVEKMWIK